MQRYRHVYGPVLSRRLGRSLGVDIIPFKTCSYDCVYCLLGRTTCHTLEIREYAPSADVLEEIRQRLQEETPDAISFAGSGEPTLNSSLGEIIDGIKAMTDIPVVVFTNSSLLWDAKVRQNLARADIISPSLDAVLPASAEAVNRLVPGLDVRMIYEGLKTFCHDFHGRIWLEVLLVAGINDTDDDIEALSSAIKGLDNIECVQLNTVVRPPAERSARALGMSRLQAIAKRLPGKVEIIASSFGTASSRPAHHTASAEEVLDLIERHPSTAEGIAEGLDSDLEKTRGIVKELVRKGSLLESENDGKIFYLLPQAR